MTRPTWDETWLHVAAAVAERSLCERAQVGAVIVDQRSRIVTTAYNGPPKGFEHNDQQCSAWCERAREGHSDPAYVTCPSLHAEANAIAVADFTSCAGGTIFVTSDVCWSCAKLIANTHLIRVVVAQDNIDRSYRNPAKTYTFLRHCGVDVELLSRCSDCGRAWRGGKRKLWLNEHKCLLDCHPKTEDLLRALDVEQDEHGCLIPTRNAGLLGKEQNYWQLPRTYERLIGDRYAHRAMLILKLGRSLLQEATHECGPDHYENSHCVNPEHLVERSHAENHQYMHPETRLRISKAGAEAAKQARSRG